MADLVFKETQRFNQPLIWIIILSCFIPFHIFGIRELVNESSKGNNFFGSDTVQAVVIGMVVLYLIVFLFLQMKLETKIDAHSIQYRYPPVINQWRKISKNEIISVEVIKYSPWTVGGWGIKYSWNGWTFNARGNKGILIKMKNGKQLLIGTQKVVQAKDAINVLLRQDREFDYGK
jgi:hypothetical protein